MTNTPVSAPPRVSIGMPVYNGAEYLRDTLDSLAKQTFSDYELIISDNASTDETEAICREYASRDSRIHYIRNPKNIGASDNYNAVFYHARGEYFKWASSNDLCHERFVEDCVTVLDERPDAVLSYPRARLFVQGLDDAQDYDDNVDIQDEDACSRFKAFLSRVKLNNVMNGLIRSRALRRSAMIKTFYSSDMSLMAEMILYGKFVEVPQYYFYRRMDPETATKLKSDTEVLRHYDPELKNLMLFQNWKIHWEYWRAVVRAPISIREKFCLFWYLFKHLFWDKEKLSSDVVMAFKKWKALKT